MELLNRLRTAITDLHERIECLPLAAAMAQGTICREDYLALLDEMLAVHAALEDELGKHPALASVCDAPSMARCGAIRRDRAFLGGREPRPPLRATRHLAASLAGWSENAPEALLGALYVVEGSRMGSMVLFPALARALEVPAAPGYGLDYHCEGIESRPASWRRFKGALGACAFTPEQQDRVARGAAATMAGLYDLYSALGPAPGAKLEPLAAAV